MACLTVVPAFSRSFLERPIVTQTLSAGGASQPICFGLPFNGRGAALSLVIMTPFARLCAYRKSSYLHRKGMVPYLVNRLLENMFLVFRRPLLVRHHLRLQDQYHDWVLRRACTPDPVAPGVQLAPQCSGVLSQLRDE